MAAVAIDDKLRPTIRKLVKDDLAYIYDSFKKSYRELGSEQHVPRHVYWPHQHELIEKMLANPAVEFRVAADPEDANFIWGYAIIEAGYIVHYVFVRASAQRQGVAALLLKDVPRPIVTTHWTEVAEEVQKKKPGLLSYEPSRRKK